MNKRNKYSDIAPIHKWDLPDVSVFDIKRRACLDLVTACEFLNHCPIVLHIVTRDVPDLENQIACQ